MKTGVGLVLLGIGAILAGVGRGIAPADACAFVRPCRQYY